MNKTCKILLCIFAAFMVVGCDSDDFLGNYKVTDVNILANEIRVGESVRTEIFFTTKTDAGLDPDSIEVVVRIPNQLQYDNGSSRIYDSSTSDTDSIEPSRLMTCEDGSVYVLYRLSEDDLEDRSLNNKDEFGIRLNVTGVSAATNVVVDAAANESQEFSCDAQFDGESEEAVTITG